MATCAALACMLIGHRTAAQQPFVDTAPNDTPKAANEFSAPATLLGSGGDENAWLWKVSDEGGKKRWTLKLQVLPGRC